MGVPAVDAESHLVQVGSAQSSQMLEHLRPGDTDPLLNRSEDDFPMRIERIRCLGFGRRRREVVDDDQDGEFAGVEAGESAVRVLEVIEIFSPGRPRGEPER
jgi:hypothetical protein